MSKELKPKDFGLPNVKLRRCLRKVCRECADYFSETRWGGFNLCPDCDIKRMERINIGMTEIAKVLK